MQPTGTVHPARQLTKKVEQDAPQRPLTLRYKSINDKGTQCFARYYMQTTNKTSRRARVSTKGSWRKWLKAAAEATQLIVCSIVLFGTRPAVKACARALVREFGISTRLDGAT